MDTLRHGLWALGLIAALVVGLTAAPAAAQGLEAWAPAVGEHFADARIEAAVGAMIEGKVRRGASLLTRRMAEIEREVSRAFGGPSISVRRSAAPARAVLDRWTRGGGAVLRIDRHRFRWTPRLLKLAAFAAASMGDKAAAAAWVCELVESGQASAEDLDAARPFAAGAGVPVFVGACLDEGAAAWREQP